jgi:hypothetical protein
MVRFTNAIPLLISALCLAAPAWADSPQKAGADPVDAKSTPAAMSDTEKEFRALDVNGDGSLSRAELESSKVLAARFDTADKNRDGRLNLAEFQGLEADASSDDRSTGSAPSEAEPIS